MCVCVCVSVSPVLSPPIDGFGYSRLQIRHQSKKAGTVASSECLVDSLSDPKNRLM